MDKEITFECQLCNKTYKSKQKLTNHTNSKHNNIDDIMGNKCMYCNKILSRKDSLARHMKTCEFNNVEINKLKEDYIQLLEKYEKMNIFIKNITKLVKDYEENNNVEIVSLGNENLSNIFPDNLQKKILNRKFSAINEIIMRTHFNCDYPQFNNIAITNLRSNVGYKFDSKLNKFITIDIDDLIDEIIENRIEDIKLFHEKHKNQMGEFDSNKIEKLIEIINSGKLDNLRRKEIIKNIYNNSGMVKIKKYKS